MGAVKNKMLQQGKGKSSDFGKGAEGEKIYRMQKAATTAKGKVGQTKGSGNAPAKARYKALTSEKKYSEDLEF